MTTKTRIKPLTGYLGSTTFASGLLVRWLTERGINNGERRDKLTLSRVSKPLKLAHWQRPAGWVAWGLSGTNQVTAFWFSRKPTAAELTELSERVL